MSSLVGTAGSVYGRPSPPLTRRCGFRLPTLGTVPGTWSLTSPQAPLESSHGPHVHRVLGRCGDGMSGWRNHFGGSIHFRGRIRLGFVCDVPRGRSTRDNERGDPWRGGVQNFAISDVATASNALGFHIDSSSRELGFVNDCGFDELSTAEKSGFRTREQVRRRRTTRGRILGIIAGRFGVYHRGCVLASTDKHGSLHAGR